VQRLIVAVVNIGRLLGSEIGAVRMWRRSSIYRQQAAHHARLEKEHLETIADFERMVSDLKRQATEGGIWGTEILARNIVLQRKQAEHHALMRSKWEHASNYPWQSVAPDPLPPTHDSIRPVLAAVLIAMAGERKWLDLSDTAATDADLRLISGWTRLRWLDLSSTEVTDAGLEHLKEMRRLEWLDLSKTRITDAGLSALNSLARLKLLRLAGTEVTDVGLEYLKEMIHLEDLDVFQTGVTEAGVEELEREMPGARIEYHHPERLRDWVEHEYHRRDERDGTTSIILTRYL
jgi:hypothetical protein